MAKDFNDFHAGRQYAARVIVSPPPSRPKGHPLKRWQRLGNAAGSTFTGGTMQLHIEPTRGLPMDSKRPGGNMKSQDPAEPTRSQLLPLGGEWQELVRKPYFVPGVLVCLCIALLFSFMGSPSRTVTVMLFDAIPVGVPIYTIVLAFFIVAGGAFAVYRMAGKPKAWWLMPVVALFTGLLVYSPVLSGIQAFYGVGGGARSGNDGVAAAFVKALFSAGLPEETFKALPVLLGAWIGVKLIGRLHAQHPARQLAVLEPLDGILIGVASGFGFAFAETVFQYVPKVIVDGPETVRGLIGLFNSMGLRVTLPRDTSNLQDIYNLYTSLAQRIGAQRATFELAQIVASRQGIGLELMIPRLLSDVFGHAAYSGILGYFIGLAAMKPIGRIKTVLIGLATAATIHGLWNSVSGSLFMYFLLSMVAFVGLAVAIQKARSLSPERSQLVASQVIDRFSPAYQPVAASPAMPRPAAPPMPAPSPVPAASTQPAMPGGAMATQAHAAPASITWDDDSNLRLLEVGSARIPATVGARLFERQLPGMQSARGDSVVAEVNANPADPSVLGVKNLSDAPWEVTMRDGSQRTLQPGRSILLAEGMLLRLGSHDVRVR